MDQDNRSTVVLLYSILSLYILFIGYASLSYGSDSDKDNAVLEFDHRHEFIIEPDDMALNILFYLPFGLLVASVVSKKKLRYLSPLCFLGILLSITLEFIQYFVGRYASGIDVLMNAFGFVIGYWLLVFSAKRYGLDPSKLLGIQSSHRRVKNLAAIRLIYIVVFLLFALYPFDVSLNLKEIYRQLFESEDGLLQIILDPLYHFRKGDWGNPDWILVFLGYLPVGVLTGIIDHHLGRFSLTGVLRSCLFLSLCTEIVQFFVLTQVTDIYNIIISILSSLVSWIVLTIWRKNHSGSIVSNVDDDKHRIVKLYITIYFIFLCLVTWAPYRFETRLAGILEKIKYESNWIPFKNHVMHHTIGNAVDILKETGLFIPFGILLYLWIEPKQANTRFRIVTVTTISFFISFFLELSQGACFGRYLDVTDVILATFGSTCGAISLIIYDNNKKKVRF